MPNAMQIQYMKQEVTLTYTHQPFYICRRDIFYLKRAKIFRRGPIISEDVRRRSEDFQRRYEEFHLTRTQEYKGTLTSLLIKENSDKVDVTPQNVIIAAKCNINAKCNKNRRKM